MNYAQKQGTYYDENPPLVPWVDLLKRKGLSVTYKPREYFWKKHLDSVMSSNAVVLDVGCGQGHFISRLQKTYKVKATGVDVSKKSIEFANKNFKNKDVRYKVADNTKLPFAKNFFDATVSFDVLEHVENQKKAVSEMVRVTKPGGVVFIYTLNTKYIFTLDWLWERLGFDIFTRAAHKRELFVDPKWLKSEIEKKDCEVLEMELFDAFFTLALDEMIMASVVLLKKTGLANSNWLGEVMLPLYSFVSKLFYLPLNLLDQPWYRAGSSLSFVIVARKNK